jgi:hypothetical protein
MEEIKKSKSEDIYKSEFGIENENENENENIIEENILKNPTKIGNILIKYISSELKDCTWEKEGKDVNN